MTDFHAVIPAGGAGTRLWPLSRAQRPKFLLDLTSDGRTLIQQTWDRLVKVIPADHIHVVSGLAHAPLIQEQLPELTNIYAEPAPRDSMAAIGMAAAVIGQRDPDAVIGSFAADHVIADTAAFVAAVQEAKQVADTGLVCTLGITPRGPSTAFGYIEAGAAIPGFASARAITRFVEKPDHATAEKYVAGGSHYWNAGMFITRADVLLGHLERLHPELHAGLAAIGQAWDTPKREEVLESTWPGLPKIAIDHAIAEPVSLEGGMGVVPGDFGWDDIGDFEALSELAGADRDDTLWIDSDGLAIADDGTLIAVVGVPDAIVVRTRDALLVTTRDQAQRVKEVPEALKQRDRTDLV
ncbi:MAG TPA: mannose-1-phosphate guanylyltransferase [Aeromicrobium sp.]|nr:mannose-1-phosphate guanylyltransferase [Aeromicrobium sp.]